MKILENYEKRKLIDIIENIIQTYKTNEKLNNNIYLIGYELQFLKLDNEKTKKIIRDALEMINYELIETSQDISKIIKEFKK